MKLLKIKSDFDLSVKLNIKQSSKFEEQNYLIVCDLTADRFVQQETIFVTHTLFKPLISEKRQ